ncbi:MAG: exonuclease SbcCD subunit D [Planctomycetota bacterium]
MFKFLHAADLHLDSPMLRLGQYDDAPAELLRTATRQAVTRLVDVAIAERVAFVLISGDIYDGDWDDVRTGLFMVQQYARLREAQIPVFVIAGNHDAITKMTYNVTLPSNVTFFGHQKPATHRLEHLDVAIHGQSFSRQTVRENLASGYPEPVANCFNIGLLHTSLDGREGHATYAPCSVADLTERGYDYWALGHIHTREIVAKNPWIVFPGNIQGRNVRETGERGVMLVTVDDSRPAAGRVTVEFRPVDVVRWERVPLDAAAVATPEALQEQWREKLIELRRQHAEMPLAVRAVVQGTCDYHVALVGQQSTWESNLRAIAQDVGRDELWVEKIKFATQPRRTTTASSELDGPLAEVSRIIETLLSDEQQLAAIQEELSEVRDKLPRDLREGQDAWELMQVSGVRQLLAEIEPLLQLRLNAAGDESERSGR